MQSILRNFLIFLVVACCIVLPSSAQPPVGGDNGWYAVNCNVDGAQVYFDNEYQGVIQGGVLYVPVYTTGAPYSTYRVEKDGYATYYSGVNSVPGKGEVFDLYATLNPTEPVPPTLIGGDVGWYTVHSNVEGATVMFDNEVKGTISQSILSVQVYTTGTPYRTYTLTKDGYTTYTGSVDRYPAKGETIDLYATMNPAPAPTQKSPLSPALAGGALLIVGLLLVAGRKTN
ncbi:hypothetical protein F8E02_09515 [Methanoculleus sp. Wushi-C6]|uniref:PEGA domain-containing protein n=1 Tax=Methanoculleus caldifontis TaxID=2651577 RepID=A0ABU3X2E6_9EURY|nr:hypothetical protein [Methanoculleus sp. Wushi-C6]MDV2482230.1 hypothetical protein [Methanoculleus sp. Wushi-C6]